MHYFTTISRKHLIAFIFIDNPSKQIVYAGYYDNTTTENTLDAFRKAIKDYGLPERIYLLTMENSFYDNGDFGKLCNQFGINHILGRVDHLQTHGKIERWIGTYKMEFQPMRWILKECMCCFLSKFNTF